MGERQILLRDVALEGGEVPGASRVAVGGPDAGLSGESREGEAHVVGGASEHPGAVAGQRLQAAVAAGEVLRAAGNDVSDADRLLQARVDGDVVFGVAVLPVEESGRPAQRAGEGRMCSDVAHPFSAEPDLPAAGAQAG